MEKFEIVFLDDDNETILEKKEVERGSSVKYSGQIPQKELVNGIKYIFIGWTDEEKLKNVQENLTLVAKYVEEANVPNMEDALFNATLEITKKTDLNSTISAGNKLSDQKSALERDVRTPQEIVEEVAKYGKVELKDPNTKDDIDR